MLCGEAHSEDRSEKKHSPPEVGNLKVGCRFSCFKEFSNLVLCLGVLNSVYPEYLITTSNLCQLSLNIY